MATLFISDIHLDAARPEMTDCFLRLLKEQAMQADAVYILGDLFEAWIGDDEQAALHCIIAEALHQVTQSGIPVFLMHGNRDFLLGAAFIARTGCKLLSDPTVISLYGQPTLITHGDLLCTDDKSYLRYRYWVRKKLCQSLFLGLPLQWRQAIAERLRAASQRHMRTINSQIMDVTEEEVVRTMTLRHVTQLIHGHTHRPMIRYFTLHGQRARHLVLSDWEACGNMLVYAKGGDARLVYLN